MRRKRERRVRDGRSLTSAIKSMHSSHEILVYARESRVSKFFGGDVIGAKVA
jgi:hypothetical protein